MYKTAEKPSKKKMLTDADRRWKKRVDEAWKAVEGMWADQKLEDPVAYQRRIRRDRKLPR